MGAGACRAPAVGERGAGAAAVHLPGGQGFGKMADTGMCIMPCFYDAPLHKGLLYHLDDGTTLRIRPILNEAGEPELLIRCVTEETVEEMMEGVKP